jgi:hypothetical protein
VIRFDTRYTQLNKYVCSRACSPCREQILNSSRISIKFPAGSQPRGICNGRIQPIRQPLIQPRCATKPNLLHRISSSLASAPLKTILTAREERWRMKHIITLLLPLVEYVTLHCYVFGRGRLARVGGIREANHRTEMQELQST